MKKLMIAAAIVCAAAVSQAAFITWSSGELPTWSDCTGEMGMGTATGDWTFGCVKMFVWESTTDLGYESSDEVWAAVQNGDLALDAATSQAIGWPMTSVSIDGDNIGVEGTTGYAAVLFLHDETFEFTLESSDAYIANYASGEAKNLGGMVDALSTNYGGGEGAALDWQAVPEPTTGLLMLLGMAGLALRRRRA